MCVELESGFILSLSVFSMEKMEIDFHGIYLVPFLLSYEIGFYFFHVNIFSFGKKKRFEEAYICSCSSLHRI